MRTVPTTLCPLGACTVTIALPAYTGRLNEPSPSTLMMSLI